MFYQSFQSLVNLQVYHHRHLYQNNQLKTQSSLEILSLTFTSLEEVKMKLLAEEFPFNLQIVNLQLFLI